MGAVTVSRGFDNKRKIERAYREHSRRYGRRGLNHGEDMLRHLLEDVECRLRVRRELVRSGKTAVQDGTTESANAPVHEHRM